MRKSEPEGKHAIPAFTDERRDPIGLNWQVTETSASLVHFTSCGLSVDFVQEAFLELLINSDISFELKLQQFTGREGCFCSDADWFR